MGGGSQETYLGLLVAEGLAGRAPLSVASEERPHKGHHSLPLLPELPLSSLCFWAILVSLLEAGECPVGWIW